jgi:transcriptional regulator with XRE-family HTH domain
MPTKTKPPEAKALDPLAVSVGREIDRALKSAGMSVTNLHKTTGISRTVLQGYLSGRFKPGARELKLLSEALDLSPNRMLFGRENLQDRTAIDDFLGDGDQAEAAMKVALIFGMLTFEERRSFLALLMSILEPRMGGKKEIGKALSVVNEMVKSMRFMDQDLSDEKLSMRVDVDIARLVNRFDQIPGTAKPSERTKPGKKQARKGALNKLGCSDQ